MNLQLLLSTENLDAYLDYCPTNRILIYDERYVLHANRYDRGCEEYVQSDDENESRFARH